MSKEAPVPVKKGTVKTEAIIGQGLKLAETAVKAMQTAVARFDELPKTLEQLSLQIASKEDHLSQLDQDLADRRRQNKISIDLDYKENREIVVLTDLTARGMTQIGKQELANLNTKVAELEKSNKDEINAAIGAVTAQMKRSHDSELKLKEAEFATREAQNVAKVTGLEKEVAFLNNQLQAWQKQLDEQRKASVEMSKANQIITLGSNEAAPRR